MRTSSRPEQCEPWPHPPVASVLATGLDRIEHGKRLARHAQRAQSVPAACVDHRACNGRVNVKMMVRIDVIERQAGRGESIELRRDFRRELFAHFRAQEDLRAERRHVTAQPSIAVDEVREVRGRKRGTSVDEREVQPDSQRREAARALDRVGDRRPAHHQARSAQNPPGVGKLDGAIDLRRQAEVVGGDDQRLQCALCCRSRRNWKNSTPSRSRRFIICGLLTISPTIDAIFERRK